MSTKIRGEQLDLTDIVNDIETSLDGIYLRIDGTVAMTGTLKAINGTENAPAYTFANNTSGGLWYQPIGTGSINLIGPDAAGASANGGSLEIKGGAGGLTSGNGGPTIIRGGEPTDGAGGVVQLFGEDGVGADKGGGAISLFAGDSTGTAIGAGISLEAGNSDNQSGGSIFLTVGKNNSNNDPGTVIINAVTGADQATRLQFLEAPTSGGFSISLKAPDAIATTSRTWTLPDDDPTAVAGQFLTTDASGVLSFADPTPAFVGAHVFGAVNSLSTSWTAVQNSVIDYDTDGFYTLGSPLPDRFVIPAGLGGYYFMTANFHYNVAAGDGTYTMVGIAVNGTTPRAKQTLVHTGLTGAGFFGMNVTFGPFFLNAGDDVRMVHQGDDTGQSTGGGFNTYFTIRKVG